MVCTTPPSQEELPPQIWDSYIKLYRRYALDTIILENEVRGQGHSDPKMVCDTQASQDAFTYQIWNSYFKEYRRYATVSRN